MNIYGIMLGYALTYARHGWPLFPVRPTKDPYVSQYQDSMDRGQLEAWWMTYPDALIGHRPAEDEMILDVDPRHGGDTTLRALVTEYGPFAPTWSHRSGRGDGGGHIWFKLPLGLVIPVAHRLDQWAKDVVPVNNSVTRTANSSYAGPAASMSSGMSIATPPASLASSSDRDAVRVGDPPVYAACLSPGLAVRATTARREGGAVPRTCYRSCGYSG